MGLALVWMVATAWGQSPGDPANAPDQTEPADEAKRLYGVGTQMYAEGRYALAIEAFQRAFDLTGHADLLFNIANAQERMGDLKGAIDTLDRYRLEAPEGEQLALRRRLQALEDRVVAMEQTAAPQPRPLTTEPAPTMSENRRRPRVGWTVGGLGAAVGFGAMALAFDNASSRAVDEYDRPSYARWRAANNTSLALAGVGLAAASAGLVFQVPVGPKTDKETP
ncbi:MAG: tetratricopeptide repeat protein [Myxococcales bacterium]|nr:tetratricopeptide repeat protein [Myxococcales bacterium]